MSLQAALEVLDENDAIWEAELTDQLRSLATTLEGRIAGLEVERDVWKEATETEGRRADRYLRQRNWAVGVASIAVVVAIILGVT